MGWTTRAIRRWSAVVLVAVSVLAAACASSQRTVVRPSEPPPPQVGSPAVDGEPDRLDLPAPDPAATSTEPPADPYEDVHLAAVPGPAESTPPEPITPTPLDELVTRTPLATGSYTVLLIKVVVSKSRSCRLSTKIAVSELS